MKRQPPTSEAILMGVAIGMILMVGYLFLIRWMTGLAPLASH